MGKIARAFQVPERTMARRLVRAKRKIKAAGIPFRVPPSHLLRERLDSALAVVYLIFNEGYGGRDELAAEAICLGRTLSGLPPEVHGLLAMMLLHDSRREARFRDAELVLLGDQDLSRWNTEQIAAGRAALDQALARRGRGPYVLPAAIASLHAELPRDWAQIASLYSELGRLTSSPLVELNRAIAIAETERPRGRFCALSSNSVSTTFATCTRPRRNFCDASGASMRRARPIYGPESSPTPALNGASSNGGSQNSQPPRIRVLNGSSPSAPSLEMAGHDQIIRNKTMMVA
ncbi:RNA polymerase sigma factor [Nocardia sp. NPDC004582]